MQEPRLKKFRKQALPSKHGLFVQIDNHPNVVVDLSVTPRRNMTKRLPGTGTFVNKQTRKPV